MTFECTHGGVRSRVRGRGEGGGEEEERQKNRVLTCTRVSTRSRFLWSLALHVENFSTPAILRETAEGISCEMVWVVFRPVFGVGVAKAARHSTPVSGGTVVHSTSTQGGWGEDVTGGAGAFSASSKSMKTNSTMLSSGTSWIRRMADAVLLHKNLPSLCSATQGTFAVKDQSCNVSVAFHLLG